MEPDNWLEEPLVEWELDLVEWLRELEIFLEESSREQELPWESLHKELGM